MKIYFAHSICDFNTEYEKLCIELIRKEYPNDDIINTKAMLSREDKLKLGKGGGKGFMEVVKKLEYFIDICDIVICAKTWNDIAFRGRYTPEVDAEIEYAKKAGKKILEFGE